MVPFIAAASYYEATIYEGFEDKTKTAYEISGDVAAEAIKNIRTVASLSQEIHFEDRFAEAIQHPHELARHKAFFASIGFGANQGFQMYCNALGFWGGIKLIQAGQINFEDMFIVIMAVMMAAQGIGRSSTFTMRLTKGKFAAFKVWTASLTIVTHNMTEGSDVHST